MEQLFASYPSARLWTAALFLGAALPLALRWLPGRRRQGGGASVLLGLFPFAVWEILLFVVLLAPGPGGGAWRDALLATALAVVPLGLTATLLVSGDTRLLGPACAALGLGALAVPGGDPGVWIVTASLLGLLGLLGVLIFRSTWSTPLGCAAGATALAAIGGLSAAPAGEVLGNFCSSAVTAVAAGHVGIGNAWWLLLLFLVPLVILLSFRSLAGLGPTRRCLAIGLRCLLIVLLTLALARVFVRPTNEAVTVLFLYDRSLSIPQEPDPNAPANEAKDLREERILQFINDAVARRGSAHRRDSAGLILFGRWPRLELPPARVPRFNLQDLPVIEDSTYTDIAAALKLALASFPEGTGKRIVLISDGNENLGNAEEQARIARQNGVEIDVLPVAAGRHNENEVLVERLEAPALTEQDSRLPIRILLRSHNPNIVVGKLTLLKTSMDLPKGDKPAEGPQQHDEVVLETVVRLRHGLNAFYFQQPASKREAYSYEAKFLPGHVEDARGKLLQRGLPGDRPENNRASVNVIARGKRTVLLVEPNIGDHRLLVERLHRAKQSLRVLPVTPGQLPQDPTQLTQFLTRFDSVILANLPAESLTEGQQKVLRSNVHDQGCGLVMVGGPQSYGAGGWQGTEVEKALPVTCDLKSLEIEGKSGLVLVMHATEMAEGNMWQKKIAQTAVQKLAPVDMVGVTYFAWDGQGGNNGHTWHVPFMQVGPNRNKILRLLDTMNPGDMPDAEPSLKMAHGALTDKKHALNKKLIIFISDGDHWAPPLATLAKLKASGIPCTTVCVTTHGPGAIEQMKKVAKLTGGRTYNVTKPEELPAIYMKETRLISQAFIHEQPFPPTLLERAGPTEGLPAKLPQLHGFVRTTRRPGPLVHVPIEKTEKRESFPVLAYWHYGLGKAVAFTSDARTVPGVKNGWDVDWASEDMHAKFWEQVVDWSLRAVDSGKNLTLATEVRDGKVRVTITARDEKQRPLTDLVLRGGVTRPKGEAGDGRRPGLTFVQKGVGVYEAEVRAEDIGPYFIHAQAVRRKDLVGKDGKPVLGKDGKPQQIEEVVDAVRTGVTIPYSPEFAEMESNPGLLERLRDLTGGKSYTDDAAALAEAARDGTAFRPTAVRNASPQSIWSWLVLLAGVCLFFDVAVRRISIDPLKLSQGAQAVWARLLGQAAAGRKAEFLERLQSRKAQVGEGLEKGKAERRFEGGATGAPPPAAGEVVPPAPKPGPKPAAPSVGPEGQKEPGDYASRLLRAKRKAMEERDKDKGTP